MAPKRTRSPEIIDISSDDEGADITLVLAPTRERHKRLRHNNVIPRSEHPTLNDGPQAQEDAVPGSRPSFRPKTHDEFAYEQLPNFTLEDLFNENYNRFDFEPLGAEAPAQQQDLPGHETLTPPIDLTGSDAEDQLTVITPIEPETPLTEQEKALLMFSDLFPDISHQYVLQLYAEKEGSTQDVIDLLLEAKAYPRERQEKPKEDQTTPEVIDYSAPGRPPLDRNALKSALAVLKVEFTRIPTTFIRKILESHHNVFPAYHDLINISKKDALPYRQHATGRPINVMYAMHASSPTAKPYKEELKAAKEARSQADMEELNVATSRESGNMAECAVCFDESPTNRMVQCTADKCHFTCLDCTLAYVKSEVGQGSANVVCPHGEDGIACEASYTESQLNQISDKRLLQKLYNLQQQAELRKCGFEDLAECPFCDFKAIYPPVEENFEFECLNEDCSVLSCRRCSEPTHKPISCEEYKKTRSKDNALEQRHKIEEAMTEALVRSCNSCNRKFVKEYGCNKMTCSCGNKQCYACGESIKDYDHFHKPGSKCPLHDDLKERHRLDVERAEKAAREVVQQENPNVQPEDLEIKMAESVRKTARRGYHAGAPHRMDPLARLHNRLGRAAEIHREYLGLMNPLDGGDGERTDDNDDERHGDMQARRRRREMDEGRLQRQQRNQQLYYRFNPQNQGYQEEPRQHHPVAALSRIDQDLQNHQLMEEAPRDNRQQEQRNQEQARQHMAQAYSPLPLPVPVPAMEQPAFGWAGARWAVQQWIPPPIPNFVARPPQAGPPQNVVWPGYPDIWNPYTRGV